jgi:soluble lytic murein transglycosylase-like protein
MKTQKGKIERALIFVIILMIVTMPVSTAAATRTQVQYTPPQSSDEYLKSQGITLWNNFDSGQCQAGQDFIVQVSPLGCEPSVVRSDLLAEQNVPVFCQLSATKINPLIDVNVIDRISFTGKQLPKEVSGVGFYPAQAAIKSTQSTLLNSPVLNNIGYAVIVLKQQQNESSMPDRVKGNLTATIKYDIKNAFGVGDAVFYLPEIKDDSTWNERYKQYGFWNGKGYLRAEEVGDTSVLVSIYTGEPGEPGSKLTSIRVEKDKLSREIYLPGFYCLAGLQLKLSGLEAPDTRVQLNIDGSVAEVKVGETFLENKCKVKSLDKQGLIQKTEVVCDTDDGSQTFKFSISPKLSFKVDNGDKDVGIGGKIKEIGEDSVYLAYIDKDKGGNLIAGLFEKKGKDENISEGEISGFYTSNKKDLDKWKEDGTKPTDVDKQKYFLNVGQKVKDTIELVGFGGAQNLYSGLASNINYPQFKQNFDNAITDYKSIEKSYGSEKFDLKLPDSEENTYGAQAYIKAIQLASGSEQRQTMAELCNEMKQKYPNSMSKVKDQCTNEIKISNSESSLEVVSINGYSKGISFEGIREPSKEEYSADVLIGNTPYNLRKDVTYYIGDKNQESIRLISLEEDSAKVSIQIISGKTPTETAAKASTSEQILKKGITQNFDSAHSFTLTGVNLKKSAKVSIVSNINNAQTQANFSFNIGIEKRAIELIPSEVKKKIDSLNKTITDWQEKSDALGKMIKGFKAACLGVSAYLVVKSFFAGFTGEGAVRSDVTASYRKTCQTISGEGREYPNIDACLLHYNNQINTDVQELTKIKKNIPEAINASNIGTVKDAVPSEGIYKLDEKGEVIQNTEIKLSNKDALFSDAGLKSGDVTQTDSKRLLELNQIINDNQVSPEIKTQARAEQYAILSRINQESVDKAGYYKALEGFKGTSLEGASAVSLTTEKTREAPYTGGTSGSTGFKNTITKDTPVQVVTYKNTPYIVSLEGMGSGNFNVVNVYDAQGTPIGVEGGVGQEIKTNFQFKKTDSYSYKNKYKTPEVRYFETGNAKGYPQIVPFDVDRGWYVATRSDSFTQAGQPTRFYIGNVMQNGVEEFDVASGDDKYRSFDIVSGVISDGGFPGLSSSESETIAKQAIAAIKEAQRKYKAGLSGDITINGQKVKVGKPAVNIPGTNCQDVMSPKDCNLLFNVCDPVICPSSRCNLGGNYYSDDVIASGIIGSLVLCLPNFGAPSNGGVLVPICLSGVKAGIDSLLSVLTSYRDCLQENLNTGKYVGICDEVYSIYLCEFFWRQALPLTKFFFTKVLGAIFNTRGGGEYFGMSGAWTGAENSVSYITQHYAVNSFNAFKARSTDEVGSEVCKNFISARYPASGDFFDALLEPDSPSQYQAWFSEIPFTTATVPPTSQYKVFYHIYSGNDTGVNYQVYLRAPEGTTLYNSNPRILIASGYITKGGYKSETKDLIGVSGYKELCVSVNAKEDCGFKQVSTSFALNYVASAYAAEQASDRNIHSEDTCISGSMSVLGLATTPNVQEGASTAISPNIRQSGITRVCSTDNPGKGSDAKAMTSESRWINVGNCDNGKGKLLCWLDTQSVKEAINVGTLEKAALQDSSALALNDLQKRLGMSDTINSEHEKAIKTALEKPSPTEVELKQAITIINTDYDTLVMNNDKAKLLSYRGDAYAKIAGIYRENLEKAVKAEADKKAAEAAAVPVTGTTKDVTPTTPTVQEKTTNVIVENNLRGVNQIAYLIKQLEATSVVDRTCSAGSNANNYASYLYSAAKEYNIPDPLLLLSIMMQESNCDTTRVSKSTPPSVGLMQINLIHKGEYGFTNEGDFKKVLIGDPNRNIQIGAQILSAAYKTYNLNVIFQCKGSDGNIYKYSYKGWDAALRAYNGLGGDKFSCSDPQVNYVGEVMERYNKLKISYSRT